MVLEVSLNHIGFSAEVDALSIAGESIPTDKTLEHSAEELPTCGGYVIQQEKIVELLTLYKELIRKDTADLEKMNAALHELDSSLSTSFTK